MELKWEIRKFEDFSLRAFHDLIQLRIEVFVLEQDCPYQDLDGLDIDAWHVTATNEDGMVVACSRILSPGALYDQVSFGRVLTKMNKRGRQLGHEVVKRTIDFIQNKFSGEDIKISAQEYLIKFYETHGFKQSGEGYLEDGIPHVPMILKQA